MQKKANLPKNRSLITKIIITFVLGFAAHVPVVLIMPTLSTWLAKAGVNYSSIGVFSLLTLPYIIKFLFAPFFDRYTLPLVGNIFGKKRSWIILFQICTFCSIVALAHSDPVNGLYYMAICSLFVAIFSSLQDIVIDSYRIAVLTDKEQIIGSSNVLLGSRFAYLICGAISLFLVDYLCSVYGLCLDFINWKIVYLLCSALSISGAIAVLFMGEPPDQVMYKSEFSNLLDMIRIPLGEVLHRRNSILILLIIITYRSCDSFIVSMVSPFLLDIGFSLTEIAVVVKTFGLISLVIGGVVGAKLVYRYGIMRTLIVGAIVQMVSNIMFVVQAKVGYSIVVLYLTIATENVCGSIATTAILGYIAELSSKTRFSGTVYAMFSSLILIDRSFLPIVAGLIADNFGWTMLFSISVALGIPALLMVIMLNYREASQPLIA